MRFGPQRDPGHFFAGDPGFDVLSFILWSLLIAALVAGIALLVISIRRTAAAPSGVMPIAPVARDDALAQLRLRYARGDVSRDEFLQASADLTGTPLPEQPPPS